MLFAVVFSIVIIVRNLDFSFIEMTKKVIDSNYSQIVFTEWQDARFFVKQFLSGAFIAIVMTGLDQDMMQKNLSCKKLPDAQKM